MMFKSIDVWKRLKDGRLVRYRCFEQLPDGGYCVQSADFYDIPLDARQEEQHQAQFLELLSEQMPPSRAGISETLEEAIARHDAEFG